MLQGAFDVIPTQLINTQLYIKIVLGNTATVLIYTLYIRLSFITRFVIDQHLTGEEFV